MTRQLPPSKREATTLTDAAHMLAAGEIDAVGLVTRCLDRIACDDGVVNAFIWHDREAALARAGWADAQRRQKTGSPTLLGIPMAHKDMFDLAGRPSTCGAAIRRDERPAGQATAVGRLEEAGAVTLGGLNMSEFAQGPTGHNRHFGDCRNPWNPAFVSGGSSSGSGAAVASGMVLASLGSDTGGSIRIPASCCGVTGLKPTYGRVSRFGAMPLSFSMDCIGPLARSARDCAVVMTAIAGHDPRDRTSSAEPVDDYVAALDGATAGDLSDCRIGVPRNAFFDDVDAPVMDGFERAMDVFSDRGAQLQLIDLPVMDAVAAYSAVVSRVELASFHKPWMRGRPGDYGTSVSARMYPAYAIPGVHYVEALRRRGAVLRAFASDVFGKVDLIASPTIAKMVPTRAQTDVESGQPGVVAKFLSLSTNTRLFSYLGLPAISVPCGFDTNGLPIGLQLAGRPFAESRLLRAAHAYQTDTDWHRMAPSLRRLEKEETQSGQ